MKIIEKNEGQKILYAVKDTEIIFNNGELSLDLSLRQRDWPVHDDVCFDENGALVLGAAAGRSYVAELDIPKREYIYPDGPEDSENATEGGDTPQPEPVPLDMDEVTLSLWAVK